jgi:hypothetical protein
VVQDFLSHSFVLRDSIVDTRVRLSGLTPHQVKRGPARHGLLSAERPPSPKIRTGCRSADIVVYRAVKLRYYPGLMSRNRF